MSHEIREILLRYTVIIELVPKIDLDWGIQEKSKNDAL